MKKYTSFRTSSRARAFTLVELMVVVAIIAILTGILVTNLSGAKAKARDGKRISDVGQIQLGLELYFDRCHQYPAVITNDSQTACTTNSGTTVHLSDYINPVPTPPSGFNVTSYDYATNSVNGSNPTDYILHTKLESYNEVIKDALPSNAYGSAFTCSNTAASLDYCIGPK